MPDQAFQRSSAGFDSHLRNPQFMRTRDDRRHLWTGQAAHGRGRGRGQYVVNMPVIRPQKNGLHVQHVAVRPVRKRACTCEPTSCCIVMLMLVGAAGYRCGHHDDHHEHQAGLFGAPRRCAPRRTGGIASSIRIEGRARPSKASASVAVTSDNTNPTFFGEEAFLSPALFELIQRSRRLPCLYGCVSAGHKPPARSVW